MNQEEIEQTIDQIKATIQDGDYDSQGQKEKVQNMIEQLYYPATALEDQRYTVLGESMYITTHLGASKRGALRQSLPILRADKEALIAFLRVADRLGILSALVKNDVVLTTLFVKKNKYDVVVKTVEEINSADTDYQRETLIQVLGTYLTAEMLQLLGDEKEKVNISTNPGILAFIQTHRQVDGSMDYRAMGKYFYDNRKEGNGQGTSASISFLTAMLKWSEEPSKPRKSQKARGIQAMSGDDYTRREWLWQTKPALFLSLEDATEAKASELMATMRLVFGTVKGVFQQGIFIRTCPASPRPGALENVKAHTPTELLKGVRYLGRGMLDKDCADYDPEGCLCVMPFIAPTCSAVAVVGHREIVMGPSFDGVTAGGGSNIIIPINQDLSNKMRDEVQNMNLEDGMDAHEIELVWTNKRWPQPHLPIEFKKATTYAGYDTETLPVITQVRGLHEHKQTLAPPPIVDGEALTVRGNIPTGSIEQETFINVGSGDLSECINLEQMAEKGELPMGLVVYAPSGSSNAHVAGVGIQWEIPVIYGIMPRGDGTIWTEISGWVTDMEGAEPAPYNPCSLSDFYMEGCKDGDRFWDYGYHVLSQFFHTYLTGPRNDPRFEAYLGGYYTSWILKATLAVAMGEARHAWSGSKARYHPVHGLTHAYICGALTGCHDADWHGRDSYYSMLKQKEVGIDNLARMLKCYSRIFKEPKWPSSYGGKNYHESVEKAVAVAETLSRLNSYHSTAIKSTIFATLLGEVNTLENAVHNCSFFFNKFVANKKWFDIGTGHHSNTAKLEHQYNVVSGLHYHFYKDILGEEHAVSEHLSSIEAMWAESRVTYMSNQFKEELPEVLDYLSTAKTTDHLAEIGDSYQTIEMAVTNFTTSSQYCEDCDSHECGCYSGKALHHEGTCALPGCTNTKCAELRMANEFGMTPNEYQNLEIVFGAAPRMHGAETPKWRAVRVADKKLFHMELSGLDGQFVDENATVFVEEFRDLTIEKGWSIIETPMKDIPHWTLNGRSRFVDWGNMPIFISKGWVTMYPQKQINALIRIIQDRLGPLGAFLLTNRYLDMATMPTKDIRAYAYKNDLGDVFNLLEKFSKSICGMTKELRKQTEKMPVMICSELYRRAEFDDWRKWTPEQLFIWAVKRTACVEMGWNTINGPVPLEGSLSAILHRLQNSFGKEFVTEVLKQW